MTTVSDRATLIIIGVCAAIAFAVPLWAAGAFAYLRWLRRRP